MTSVPDEDELWNEAMALLLAWQAAESDDRARDAIRNFCERSPRHLVAWNEAKRVYHVTGQAIGMSKRRRPLSRRQVVGGLAAIAAGGGVFKGSGLVDRWRSDETTGTGEIRRIALPDGSWLTLGPDSAVDIAFSQSERRIVLREGMALCETVSDGARAFLAQAGKLFAKANAGTFEIRCEEDWSLAAVERGKIAVTLSPAVSAPFDLTDGEWVSLGPQPDQLRRGQRDKTQIAAWRERLLVADREDVATIVAEIARWHRGRILIPQASLARAPVSGLFDLSDPGAALAAAVAPYGGKVRQISPWLTVLTTI